jgi:hypothetical protein
MLQSSSLIDAWLPLWQRLKQVAIRTGMRRGC